MKRKISQLNNNQNPAVLKCEKFHELIIFKLSTLYIHCTVATVVRKHASSELCFYMLIFVHNIAVFEKGVSGKGVPIGSQ